MCRIKRSLYDDFTTIDVDFALHGRNWIVKANDCGILRITEKQVVVPVRGNKKRIHRALSQSFSKEYAVTAIFAVRPWPSS